MASAKLKEEPRIELSASLYGGSVTIQRGDFGRQKHAYYWVEKGYFVPGVTSILKILDKPALLNWAAGLAANYVAQNLPNEPTKEQTKAICEKAKTEWREVRDAAGDVGTQIHKFAENLFRGIPQALPDDPLVQNGIKALQEWIAANDVQPIEVERVVFSQACFVAGTKDLLAAVNGKLSQVDLKSGSGIYPEHMFQTGIYKRCWEEENREQIQQNIIVNLNKKTGKLKTLVIDNQDEMNFHADTFLRAKALNDNLKKMGEYA
jgi:hypothetical protein